MKPAGKDGFGRVGILRGASYAPELADGAFDLRSEPMLHVREIEPRKHRDVIHGEKPILHACSYDRTHRPRVELPLVGRVASSHPDGDREAEGRVGSKP